MPIKSILIEKSDQQNINIAFLNKFFVNLPLWQYAWLEELSQIKYFYNFLKQTNLLYFSLMKTNKINEEKVTFFNI